MIKVHIGYGDTDKHPNHDKISNVIKTSKYNAITFLPLNLFTQFSKAANMYFALICYLQTINLISISGGKPAMLPTFAFIVAVSMVKDAFEDFMKHQ
jgi:hypothetical protein